MTERQGATVTIGRLNSCAKVLLPLFSAIFSLQHLSTLALSFLRVNVSIRFDFHSAKVEIC